MQIVKVILLKDFFLFTVNRLTEWIPFSYTAKWGGIAEGPSGWTDLFDLKLSERERHG